MREALVFMIVLRSLFEDLVRLGPGGENQRKISGVMFPLAERVVERGCRKEAYVARRNYCFLVLLSDAVGLHLFYLGRP